MRYASHEIIQDPQIRLVERRIIEKAWYAISIMKSSVNLHFRIVLYNLTADIRIHETGKAIHPPITISTTIPANNKMKGTVGKYAFSLSSEFRKIGHMTASNTNTIGPANQEE